jgi:ATP-dependent exoDNAse (exonuclease V) beta subunit
MARGDVIHAVLAQIETIGGNLDDIIERAMQKVDVTAGVTRDEIRATLRSFLNDASVRDIFMPHTGRRVLRETEFANSSGMLYRLDRVLVDSEVVTVVDFKTGGDELESEYCGQVRNYISLLSDVFPGRKVNGVLAYIDTCEVRPVV